MKQLLSIILKKGKELTPEEVTVINDNRIKYFNSKTIINPREGDDDWEKDYFFTF